MDETDRPYLKPGGINLLLAHIQASRLRLEALLEPLSAERLTTSGASGWSVKDHLAHLAVWEQGIYGLLHHRPQHADMHIDEAVASRGDEDEINAIIQARYADRPLAEVQRLFVDAHHQLVETIEALAEADLYQPYAAYAPPGGRTSDQPVIGWIIGNTYGHFDEHYDYIVALLHELDE